MTKNELRKSILEAIVDAGGDDLNNFGLTSVSDLAGEIADRVDEDFSVVDEEDPDEEDEDES